MTDHDPRETSAAALYDLMAGEGSSETYRATAAIVYALHDIADAIRGTRDDRCDAGSPFWGRSACRLPKGHSDPHFYPLNPTQGATGSPQNDEQPEPGQVDGGEVGEAGGGDASALRVHGRITNDGIAIDFGNTWVRADSIDVTMATSASVRYVPESRAEKAEAEREAILNYVTELRKSFRTGSVRWDLFTAILDRHAPEG